MPLLPDGRLQTAAGRRSPKGVEARMRDFAIRTTTRRGVPAIPNDPHGSGRARRAPRPVQPSTFASSSAVRPLAMVAARASQAWPPMRAKAWSTPG